MRTFHRLENLIPHTSRTLIAVNDENELTFAFTALKFGFTFLFVRCRGLDSSLAWRCLPVGFVRFLEMPARSGMVRILSRTPRKNIAVGCNWIRRRIYLLPKVNWRSETSRASSTLDLLTLELDGCASTLLFVCLREQGVLGLMCSGLETKLLVITSFFGGILRLACSSDISARSKLPSREILLICIGLGANSPLDGAHSLRWPKKVFSSRPIVSFILAFAAFLWRFFVKLFCSSDTDSLARTVFHPCNLLRASFCFKALSRSYLAKEYIKEQ